MFPNQQFMQAPMPMQPQMPMTGQWPQQTMPGQLPGQMPTQPQMMGWPTPPQQQQAPMQQQPLFGGNPFSGMAQAKVSASVDYVRAGRYWGKINVCKTGNRQKDGVLYAAVDMTVVHVIDNNNGLGHRLGDDVSFYSQKGLYFLSDVKGFIAAATGADNPDAVDENMAAMVFGPQQPLRNMTVEFEAKERTTQEGGTFTKVSFKREVPAVEVLQSLQATCPQMIPHLYPDGILEKMMALDAQQSGQQSQMQQFAPAPAPVAPVAPAGPAPVQFPAAPQFQQQPPFQQQVQGQFLPFNQNQQPQFAAR